MARERTQVFPNRKISETLLEFAAPLLDTLRDEAPDREIRRALEVAYTAWNAVIFADVLNNNQYIDDVRRLTAGAAGPDILMEQVIARKRELFGDDARLIGDWSVKRTAGALASAPTRETRTPCLRIQWIGNRRLPNAPYEIVMSGWVLHVGAVQGKHCDSMALLQSLPKSSGI